MANDKATPFTSTAIATRVEAPKPAPLEKEGVNIILDADQVSKGIVTNTCLQCGNAKATTRHALSFREYLPESGHFDFSLLRTLKTNIALCQGCTNAMKRAAKIRTLSMAIWALLPLLLLMLGPIIKGATLIGLVSLLLVTLLTSSIVAHHHTRHDAPPRVLMVERRRLKDGSKKITRVQLRVSPHFRDTLKQEAPELFSKEDELSLSQV